MTGPYRTNWFFLGNFFLVVLLIAVVSCGGDPIDKAGLSLAVKKGDVAAIQKFFSKGGSPDIRLDYDRTLLHVACEWGQLEMARLLIQNRVDVNAADKAGYTPLMLASQQGKVEIAEALLAAGAKIDLQDEAGYTALMAASYNGKDKVVELLLKKGAGRDFKNKEGKTAVDLARPWGHKTIVRLLENAGK